jgi:hypothetical protein
LVTGNRDDVVDEDAGAACVDDATAVVPGAGAPLASLPANRATRATELADEPGAAIGMTCLTGLRPSRGGGGLIG